MENFVFQDWTIARGSGTAPYVQEAKDWLGLSSYQDVVFYLDIRSIQLSPTTGLSWNFQTAPTKDEKLFQTMTTLQISGVPTSVRVLPVITSAGGANPPLATWVRWQIVPNGGTTTWSTAFRVLVAANRVSSRLR